MRASVPYFKDGALRRPFTFRDYIHYVSRPSKTGEEAFFTSCIRASLVITASQTAFDETKIWRALALQTSGWAQILPYTSTYFIYRHSTFVTAGAFCATQHAQNYVDNVSANGLNSSPHPGITSQRRYNTNGKVWKFVRLPIVHEPTDISRSYRSFLPRSFCVSPIWRNHHKMSGMEWSNSAFAWPKA